MPDIELLLASTNIGVNNSVLPPLVWDNISVSSIETKVTFPSFVKARSYVMVSPASKLPSAPGFGVAVFVSEIAGV